MPKAGASTLFELVKSLSQTEKRYFKVFLQKYVKGDSDLYASLFDAIDRQSRNSRDPSSGPLKDGLSQERSGKDYDESKLKSFPHLAVMKVRLEEYILWGLRDYHSEKSIREKIKRDIRSIEILFNKNLFEHAKKIIAKAKKTAAHYEEFLSLFELYKWELKMINAESFASVSDTELKKIYRDAASCLEKTLNAHQYALFCDMVYHRVRKYGFFRNEAKLKSFGKFMKNPLLQSAAKAESLNAKYYFHSTHIGFASLQGKYPVSLKHNREILDELEKHPHLIQEEPRQYLSMKQNMVVWQYHLKEYSQALVSLEKLKLFITHQRANLSENLFSRTFYYANTVLLYVYSRLGMFEKGAQSVNLFKKEFENFGVHPQNKETEWMFNDAMIVIYFGAGKYSESVKCLNKIIQDKEGAIRSDIQCMTRIFSLIVHYEMGNQELLRYMVKWTYRYLIKRNRLYKFETIILEFIGKKSLHMNTRQQAVEAFKELKDELEKLLPDKFQRRPLDDFEYIEWLESKIQNKPFAEVVREKRREKSRLSASNI